MESTFIGIDVGTQGVRGVVVDEHGAILAEAAQVFELTPNLRLEQSTAMWWQYTVAVVEKLMASLPTSVNRQTIKAVGVDSTSGTVIPLDQQHQPLHAALMYSDTRSTDVGEECKALAKQFVPTGYTGFNASSGLAKMVWYVREYPEHVPQIAKWIHAADFIVGQLSGEFGYTDHTNALKSGFDLNANQWPLYLTEQLPLQRDWLLQVVPSGTPIGTLKPELAKRWGLPEIHVVVGMTDGCASQLASGAVNPGDWNTTVGTTLVIKGVTEHPIHDPEGRLYSHRHPDGYWMPGGASNTGADWISADFGPDLKGLNDQAAKLTPTPHLVWPLKQRGERFPFVAPDARGFGADGLSDAERFAAGMEGVAYIERLAYALVRQLSGERVSAVYTAGGGSNSNAWLMIRSNVLNLPIYKCKAASGAVGAAISAASKTHYGSVVEAAGKMTDVEEKITPVPALVDSYERNYQRFVDELKKRKYL